MGVLLYACIILCAVCCLSVDCVRTQLASCLGHGLPAMNTTYYYYILRMHGTKGKEGEKDRREVGMNICICI